ncbi:MAG: rod shape-determining protein [Anaerolineales bacterium]|jgi:rod shape-determining protein MreB|nr:rod shape-determining protein [Anaerolineaceae bacterium]MDP6224839.1 rod shape-determining protein [Anaerolineales bacterium]
MALFGKDVGIDLGTVNVLVYEGGDIVLHEPCVVAIRVDEQKIVSIGQEAREMYGRSPESIEVMRPIQDGVIADYEVTERMLHYFLTKVCGQLRFFKPRVMLSVPYGATSVESRAVHEAAKEAGSRAAYLIHEPLAAAIGAGLPVGTPAGNMVLDIGGGATEAAIVALYGIVTAHSARVGGIALDQAIATYVRKKYGIVIGEMTAEEIKIRIGSALPMEEELAVEIQGRDHVTGLPRDATITSGEVTEAIEEPLQAIIAVAKAVLEKTPPELASDAIDRGMVLCGGGAHLRGIDERISKSIGVPAYLADNPVGCVAVGAGRALEMYDIIRPHLPRV